MKMSAEDLRYYCPEELFLKFIISIALTYEKSTHIKDFLATK